VNDDKEVDHDKEVDLGSPQVMTCLLYYNSHVHNLNPNTKERNRLITYYKTYGITTLKKHVDNDHATIVKKIKEETNALIRGPFEKHQVWAKLL
jgi:hypothetical protein